MSERCSNSKYVGYNQRKQCSRKGSVEREGRWYCRQHDPVYIAEMRAFKEAAWKEKLAAGRARCKAEAVAKKYHARLVGTLKEVADGMVCVCNLNRFVGKEPPCDTCRYRALLAEIEEADGK